MADSESMALEWPPCANDVVLVTEYVYEIQIPLLFQILSLLLPYRKRGRTFLPPQPKNTESKDDVPCCEFK